MKYYLGLIFVVFVTVVSGQNTTNNYLVSDISRIDDIKITTSELNTLAREYGQTANFTELSVQKVSDHYVLLAKDLDQKLIYAIELNTVNSKLYIDLYKHINACESDNLSLSIFNILDGQIIGCIKANHRVLGRN